jgi:hypothetical protein
MYVCDMHHIFCDTSIQPHSRELDTRPAVFHRLRNHTSDITGGFQLMWSFQPHCGPGIDSASNRNEYQESSWGVKRVAAICEPILQKIWEPRRLTTLWASSACYRDNFTFLHVGLYCAMTVYIYRVSGWKVSKIKSLYLRKNLLNTLMGYTITEGNYQSFFLRGFPWWYKLEACLVLP